LRHDQIDAPRVLYVTISGQNFTARGGTIPQTNTQDRRNRHHGQLGQSQWPGRPQHHPLNGATLLFLPQRSPDLNPIKPPFAKLQAVAPKSRPSDPKRQQGGASDPSSMPFLHTKAPTIPEIQDTLQPLCRARDYTERDRLFALPQRFGGDGAGIVSSDIAGDGGRRLRHGVH
jgi:hypothetical protein